MSDIKQEIQKQIEAYRKLPTFLDVMLKDRERAVTNQADKVVVFGFGPIGRRFAMAFKHQGIAVHKFIDNDQSKWGETFAGIKCFPPESIKEEAKNCFVVLATAVSVDPLVEQLKKLGVQDNKILWKREQRDSLGKFLLYYLNNCQVSILAFATQNSLAVIERDIGEIEHVYQSLADEKSKAILISKLALTSTGEQFGALADYLATFSDAVIANQKKYGDAPDTPMAEPEFSYYFKQDFLNLNNDEVYIDVGAADGDTITPFLTAALNQRKTIEKIYAFEPDPYYFEKLSENLRNFNFIECFQMGVADSSGSAFFRPMTDIEGNICGALTKAGKLEIPLVSIDEFVANRKMPTLIKLDPGGDIIPGILRGAQNTIKESRPRIIAGAYHSVESIYRVPLMLMENKANYKVYLRHLAFHANETHAFAV